MDQFGPVLLPRCGVPCLDSHGGRSEPDRCGRDRVSGTAGVSAGRRPACRGQPLWDTTTVANGQYEIRAVFHDAGGNVVGRLDRQVLVNNSVAWHSGAITSNQTWTSNEVNVIDGTLGVAAGVTLTIKPGAVVKFAPGANLQVVLQSGATLNAPATAGQPIIFTSLADDTAGGDTNLDGDKSLPEPGDWAGSLWPRGQP